MIKPANGNPKIIKGWDILVSVTNFKPNKNKATILPITIPVIRVMQNQKIKEFKEEVFTSEMFFFEFIVIQIEYI